MKKAKLREAINKIVEDAFQDLPDDLTPGQVQEVCVDGIMHPVDALSDEVAG